MILEADGNSCVGIGALSGDSDIVMDSGSVSVEISAINGVCAGSMYGYSRVKIRFCSFKGYCDGSNCVGIGSVKGSESVTDISDSGMVVVLNAAYGTGVGALNGTTSLTMESASLKIDSNGEQALSVGGYSPDTVIKMNECDIRFSAGNELRRDTFADEENIEIRNSRVRFTVNDSNVNHSVIYE